MTKLPLAPIKRIAVEGGAQRIGIPAAKILAIAGEEWIKRVTIAAEKYANHAGRKTVKPEDIIVVVKDQGFNVQIPQTSKHPKPKKVSTAPIPTATVAPLPPVTPPVAPLPPKPSVVTHTPPIVGSMIQATLNAQAQIAKNI